MTELLDKNKPSGNQKSIAPLSGHSALVVDTYAHMHTHTEIHCVDVVRQQLHINLTFESDCRTQTKVVFPERDVVFSIQSFNTHSFIRMTGITRK